MFAIFLMFTLYELVIFEVSIQELKKLLSSRNEGFTFNMMQDLDQRLENTITDLKTLGEIPEIQKAIEESNLKFKRIQDIKEARNIKEHQMTSNEFTPFLEETLDSDLSDDLKKKIDFYKNEYSFDVLKELFVTNAYGANVAVGSGFSDYAYSDEEWWYMSKENGVYYGDIEYNSQYEANVIPIGFRIIDEENNFLGVMYVVLSLNNILEDFNDETELINNQHRNVILLDNKGRIIYSKGIQNSITPVSYFEQITQSKDVGFFDLYDASDNIRLVSFAKSTGYKSFEGFDWTVVIEQDSSSFIDEFVELKNSVILVFVTGMIFSIIFGLGMAKLVTNPLKELVLKAKSISKGDFSIQSKKTRITEFQEIQNSFDTMTSSLEKLIETEKQLAEAHVKIKNERFRAIGELAANMAHDLKNPLGTIKTSSDIINRSFADKDPELAEVFKRMDRAIDRITHQVQDVLDFVKTAPLNITKVSVNSLVNSAITSINIPKNVLIKIPIESVEIECDEQKLEVVFINILLNAIQAIGNKEGHIEIRIKQFDNSIHIEFEDSGEGIPERMISHIFEPLVTTKEKGTGLGLSSCKNIIEQHSGKIEARNNPTVFTLILPQKHE